MQITKITDDLVEYITGELIRRLGLIEGKPSLTLVGAECLAPDILAGLKERYELTEVGDYKDFCPVPGQSVLLTTLGLQALVRVAAGDEGCTLEGKVLLSALLEGRTVVALKKGLVWRQYLQSAPKVLLNQYRACERLLVSYGLKIVEEAELSKILTGNVGSSGCGRRIFTEERVRALYLAGNLGSRLVLSSSDILTPLAKDYIVQNRIEIVYS